ncbi:MAG: DNA polymerase III subunit epsilon [Burkholderiales bacterium]|jgi:DNA polymerase-3 subunit epsilon|nr:DNA polymerase III subunit epsilon [Burkholderiales bacterium]
MNLRQVFLDTETTGLNPNAGDRIIEIGCVEMLGRRLSGRNLHFYLNPQRASHEDAFKVHGLSDEFLADKPLFAAIADQLLQYLEGAEVIIHNAEFDVGFLDLELDLIARPRFENHVVRITDSLTLAREVFPGKSNSLDALCKRLGVGHSSRTSHGALLDAGLLAEVYLRMTRGQKSLVIDAAERSELEPGLAAIDLRTLELTVVEAHADELAAHAAVLAELDKASGGKTMWRRLPAPA